MSSSRGGAHESPARCRRQTIALTLAVCFLLLAVGIVALTPTDDDTRRLFFGKWRFRHAAMAVTALYAAVLCFCYSKSRRALAVALLATFSTLMTVAVVELAGWVGVIDFRRVFGQSDEIVGRAAVPHLDIQGQTYQDLFHRFRYPSEPIPFHLVTDRRGFRNRADRDRAEIYLLGDSILVAGLIPVEQTVTTLLEQELQATTMNVALIGLSPQDERDLFRQANLPVEKSLVLQFIFEGNDLLDSTSYGRPPDVRQAPRAQSTFCYNAMLWVQQLTDRRKLREERQIGTIAGKDYLFFWLDQSFRGVEGEFERIGEAISDLRETVTAGGGMYGVVYVPAKIRVLGPLCEFRPPSSLDDYRPHLSPLRDRMADWCQQQAIPLLDLTEPLSEAARSGNIPWFAGDTHPNAIGHRVAADAIQDWELIRTWQAGREARP